MEVYLICNDLYENNLAYLDRNEIEKKKMTRPLSIEGENAARNISLSQELNGVGAIYSSLASTSLGSAKYLANRINKKVFVNEKLNDQVIGELGSKSLKMIYFMQDHDFNIKLNNGESLEELSKRFVDTIVDISLINNHQKVAIYTHRRSILSFLIKYGKCGFSLDDNLIIEYNGQTIYGPEDDVTKIIKVKFDEGNVQNIELIELD